MSEMNRGIVAVCETDGNEKLKNVSFEIISEGKRLADITGEKVTAVVMAEKKPELSDIYACGADEIVFVRKVSSLLYDIESESWLASKVIEKIKPSVVLFGATDYGRILAPKVAAICRCGITADCTSFEINENKKLVQIRPALGGNILAHIISPHTMPQMASVRPSVLKKMKTEKEVTGHFVEVSFDIPENRKKVKELKRESFEANDDDKIENGRIIVAAGSGVTSRETLQLMNNFAKLIGGVSGCSRKLVESGWMPHSKQVGQSGKTVSPDIYIAIGISGASQHLAGMKTSGKIIAVNNDADADIFSVADIGFVMDGNLWLKEMMKFLENRQNNG